MRTRNVAAHRYTFQDLEETLGLGPIQAVEVNHLRGTVAFICEPKPTGVVPGAEVPQAPQAPHSIHASGLGFDPTEMRFTGGIIPGHGVRINVATLGNPVESDYVNYLTDLEGVAETTSLYRKERQKAAEALGCNPNDLAYCTDARHPHGFHIVGAHD